MTEVASARAVPISAPEDMHNVQTDIGVLGGGQVSDIGTENLAADTNVDVNVDTHSEPKEALKGLEALQDRPRAEHVEDVVKAEGPTLKQTEASKPGDKEDAAVPAPIDSTHVIEPESAPAADPAAPAATEPLPTEDATSSEVTTGQVDIPEPMKLPETAIQAILEAGEKHLAVGPDGSYVTEFLAGTDTTEAEHPETTKKEPEQTKEESVNVDEAPNAAEQQVKPEVSASDPSPEAGAEIESKSVNEVRTETPKESEGQAQEEGPASVGHSPAIEQSTQARAQVVEPASKSASVEPTEGVTIAQAEAEVATEAEISAIGEATEKEETPKVTVATAVERPIVIEEPVQAGVPAAGPALESTAVETTKTNDETKSQAEIETTAEAETSDDLLKVGETTEAKADEPAAEEPVQAEAPSLEPAPGPTSAEPTEPEAKLQAVEVDVQPEGKAPSDLTIESAGVQKGELVEVKQDASIEELPAAKESDPAESASEPVPIETADQAAECEANVESIQTSAKKDAPLEVDVSLAAEQEETKTPGDSSKQAYEIAHAHANDEVAFDTPTDEELKDANLDNIEPKKPEDPAGVAESTNEKDVINPSALGSGVGSLTSIPAKADETPTIVPEAKISSAPVEARCEHTEPTEPEVAQVPETMEETSQSGDVASVGENMGNVALEVKQAGGAVEPEAVVREEPVGAATSIEPATAPEHDVNAGEEATIPTEPPESAVRADAVLLSAEVPSEDVTVDQPKQDTEIPDTASGGNGIDDSSRKVEKVVIEPLADVSAEANTEVLATELVEPRDEPSGKTQVKDVAVAVEASKSSADELASAPVTGESQEEAPKDADVAKGIEKTKAIEALSSAPAEVVHETATEEATPVDEPILPREPAVKQPANTTEEMPELIQETPDVPPTQTEATPVEVAEPPAAIKEGKPEVETADDSAVQGSSGSETAEATADAQPAEHEVVAEGSGATEPAATPIVERSATADKVGTDVEQVEMLEGVSTEQATAESGEATAETQEPSISAESADSASATTVEEPIKDTVLTTEDVAIPEHGGKPASTTLDESVPAPLVDSAFRHVEEATTTKDSQLLETTEHSEIRENADVAAEPEAGARTGAVVGPEEQDLETVIRHGEAQEEGIPDVLVETPTPVSEVLTILPEDEYNEDTPLEQRIARATGIPSEEAGKLYRGPTETGPEDETTTPTEAKGETAPEEEAKVISTTEVQELETPTQLVLPERPEQDEDVAPSGLPVDTEAAEKLKSPWTPSYSVTTLGSSPVHPEEPELQPDAEKAIDAASERSIFEKNMIDTESVLTGCMAPRSTVEEAQDPEDVPIAPVVDKSASEPVTIDSASSGVGAAEPMERVAESVYSEERVVSEDEEVRPSDEIPATDDTEVLEDAGQANLLVDTGVTEVTERPKSPWTPSYSVTKMGPGAPEPKELHLEDDGSAGGKDDAQCSEEERKAQAPPQDEPLAPKSEVAKASEVVEPPLDIERLKSSYPPAYSVRQQGPGAVEIEESRLQIDERFPPSPISEVNSDEPEAPLTPRSELGAVTPGFDSLSEVSEASHIPIPPSSPRSESEGASLSEGEIRTPLVAISDDQGTPVSPLQTPLISPNKSIEALETSEPLTEFAMSGFGADVKSTAATSSWVKEANVESGSHVNSNGMVSEDATSESKEATSPENDMPVPLQRTHSTQQYDSQTVAAEETSVIPGLIVPKLNITAAPQTAQPLVITNTLSTDSAYTQISESLSLSQETGTTVTTPDIESAPISKLHGSTEAEPLEEEPVSDSTIRPLIGTPSKTKTLGIAHTLAMRSFPSAFAETEIPSTSDEPQQAITSNTLQLDDHLAPLVSEERRRLESTASSLAFPGGWVSSPPPHKERASLEVATGEFSKPIVEGHPISPISTPPVIEPPVEQKESKWRCVIM